MGKNDPEPAEPEPEPEPEINVDELASGLVTEVFDKACDVVKEKHMEARRLPSAVDAVIFEALSAVQYCFTHADPGSSKAEQGGSTWQCGEEASASPLDTWSRGAVPIKIRPSLKIGAMNEQDSSVPNGMATSRSLRSTLSKGSRRSRSRESNQQGASSPDEKEKRIIVAPSVPRKPRPVPPGDAAARKTVAELRAKEDMRKEKERLDEEERAKTRNVLSELKGAGTQYGYNHRGEIVLLENVNAERLPATDVHLRVGLWTRSQAAAAEDAEREQSESPGGKRRRAPRDSPKARKAAPPTDTAMDQLNMSRTSLDETHLANVEEMQGPEVVDGIQVASGAILKQGENEKRGPPRQKDPMHMSRKDYNKLVSVDGEGSGMPLGDTTATWDRPDDENDDLEDDVEDEPEADWMADAKPVEQPPAARPEPEGGALLHSQFNSSIMGSNEWGVNPPGNHSSYRAPYNPSMDKSRLASQREMAVGHPARLPRERPFDKVPGIPTSERAYLPAPVYPATQGHGFVNVSYLGGEHSFTDGSVGLNATPQGGAEASAASTGTSLRLPPINNASFGSNKSASQHNVSRGPSVKRSFNNAPPSHVHMSNPALAKKLVKAR